MLALLVAATTMSATSAAGADNLLAFGGRNGVEEQRASAAATMASAMTAASTAGDDAGDAGSTAVVASTAGDAIVGSTAVVRVECDMVTCTQ